MTCPRCRSDGCQDPDSRGCDYNVIMRQNVEILALRDALEAAEAELAAMRAVVGGRTP